MQGPQPSSHLAYSGVMDQWFTLVNLCNWNQQHSANSNKIIERLRLEWTFKIIQLQLPTMGRAATDQIRMPGALSSLVLRASRDGASTTSQGSLCQCLTSLCINTIFLISNLNFPS